MWWSKITVKLKRSTAVNPRGLRIQVGWTYPCTGAKYGRRWVPVLPAAFVALSLFCTPHLHASFIQNYAPDQFALTNTNADGSAISPDDGLSLIITGGNNGSGLSGTTDFVTMVQQGGLITFDYSYSACSPTSLCDTPGYDFGGYILGSDFTQLSDTTGEFGSVSVTVSSGEAFGFRVGTVDNTGEPGILTVSDFNAPLTQSAPEPGTLPVMAVVAAAAGATLRLRIRRNKAMETNTHV